jgi:hypothetical protein
MSLIAILTERSFGCSLIVTEYIEALQRLFPECRNGSAENKFWL